MSPSNNSDIITRITNILLEEEENKICCPHCNAWGVPGEDHKLIKSPMFSTISCYNCRHEWLMFSHLLDIKDE